jgi:chromosome segregation protein
MRAETQLSAHGGDDVGDALVRLEALRERTRGLANVLTERLRVIERDRGAQVDRDVIANLEADAARLRADLDAVEQDAESLIPEFERLREAELELADARLQFEDEWADGVPAPSGKAAEVRGELGALRASLERGRAEQSRLEQRLATLADDAANVDGELQRVTGEHSAVEDAEAQLAEALAAAETARDRVEDAVTTAQSVSSDVDAEWNSWSARADALALALDEARARAGAERLAGIDGVVGTLLDLVDIDEGWEGAFEAAAGEALGAVVVEGVPAAQQALATLRAGDVSGAVLALGPAVPGSMPPPVGEPVRRHVRSRHAGVSELLDALVGGAVVIDGDLFAGIDVVLAHPGSVVVTRDGDRLGLSGWRVGGTRAQATGAALEEARGRAEAAGERRAAARAALEDAKASRSVAQQALRDATRALDEHNKRVGGLAEAIRRVERRRENLGTEIESLKARLSELGERVTREQARVEQLDVALPVLEGEENETLQRGRAMAEARNRLEERAAAVGAIRTDIEMRAASLEDRRKFLHQRHAEIEERLERDAAQRAEAEIKRIELDRRQAATEHLVDIVRDRLGRIESELADLRERRRRQSEAARAIAARLDAVRRDRQQTEQRLAEQRELMNRAELEDAEATMRIEAAVEALRRDLDCEPDTAIAAECPPLNEGVTPPARIRELERELKLMGPINPLALEEFQALQERHDFLEQQVEDIRASRRELGKVIRSIDEEIVNVFAAAFADVAANFEKLFEMLFPGGKGSLHLTDPENLLDTGVEVEARPSGKNVRKLSLLSGGERSLTALAYLFAVFRSRPSPFYVMDEVEAALDDVNLHRFLGLVEEFRSEAQLLIVSHQKRTMEAADCLYGVTMQPGGSSKAVSEKVDAARTRAN